MELVGSAFLAPVCERVITAAVEEYRLVRNVEEELKKLESTVQLVKGVLQDAEEKQEAKPAVHTWLRSLKEVLLDAEDILDEAATTNATLQTRELASANLADDMKSKVRNVICCFGSIGRLPSRHTIAHEIKTIRERLDAIFKQKDVLGLQVSSGEPSLLENRRSKRLETNSILADESYVTGRDDERKNLTQLLLTSEGGAKNAVDVLCIFGMGGVGKTTLAKLVFNDLTVRQHFDLRIWVCVSEDFEIKRIIKEIMDAAVFSSDEKKELFEVSNWDLSQRRLKDKIKDKRFLLVLDDLWEEDPHKLESLFEPLKFGGKGSKIIVTTRNEGMSRKVCGIPFPLRRLSSEDLWPIFKRYAFSGCDSNQQMQLETVGRQIVGKLKGSPLAAKTIGLLLNESVDVKHWKYILKCQISTLPQHPDDILPILKLSYHHLPGHLKQCFAYCSLFPKDYRFREDGTLVTLWMAQNFIQTRGGLTVESVGTTNFNELLYKSFFEHDAVYGFVMHDLIHDLAESVSEGDFCRLGDDRSMEIPQVARHVSIATEKPELDKLKELCKLGNLRTLLFLKGCKVKLTPCLEELFTTLKRLRVLELSKCNITELPASIGNLKHLRYINLSETSIRKLPDSLSNLHNLQVLGLEFCASLRALPSNMSALINLRHLDASCELVSNIQGLTALQEIRVCGRKVSELGDMGMLKQLRLRNLEQVPSKEEAVRARLDAKEHLEELELGWENHRDEHVVNQTLEEEVLEGLRPVDSIIEMSIYAYGGVKSPSWMEDDSWVSSSFLERVTLLNCTNWEVLPPLGRLGCLKFLHISEMEKVREIGPQFFGCCADGVRVLPAGFPSLEELHFRNMPEWEEWRLPQQPHDRDEGGDDDEDGQGGQQRPQPPPILFLPRLRRLGIRDCPKLRELPPLPPTLTELEIRMVALTRLPGWLQQGVEGEPCLSSLSIERCPNLVSLRDGLLQHPPLVRTLEKLHISDCNELTSLPEFRHLTSLRSLKIRNCPKLISCPCSSVTADDLRLLPSSLEKLDIYNCGDNMIEGLLSVASLQKLTNLSHLDMGGGRSPATVARLGELLTSLPSLQKLSILNDDHLDDTSLSTCLQGLASLKYLEISGCHAITILPTAAEVMCLQLEILRISNCEELTSLGGIHTLISLQELEIRNCPKLLPLVEAAAATSASPVSSPVLLRLKLLGTYDSSPQQMTMWLRQCSSLQTLQISECPQLTCFDDEMGRELEAALLNLAPSLRSLLIDNCHSLCSLPSKLRSLSSLKSLRIDSCPEIQCLPVGGLPESLKKLYIYGCHPSLRERLKEEGGPDWPLISHIPHVDIS